MSSTRAGSAAYSKRIADNLMKLLFRGEGHKLQSELSNQHSYDALRKAYIARVQQIHPDKHYSDKSALGQGKFKIDEEVHKKTFDQNSKKTKQQEFVELQHAWDAYEQISKTMKDYSFNNRKVQDNFTLFGVGCSFSDNPEESLKRAEIMDQACNGFFSDGLLESKPTQLKSSDEQK